MDKLKFGIPKGSLEKATIELFQKAGWVIKVSTRNYFPTTDDPQLSCAIIRAQEMSRYVEEGVLDAAITGKDWILENNSEVVEVQELIYSKESPRPARWVLVVTEDSPIKKVEDLEGKKVATELRRLHPAVFLRERNPGEGRILLGDNRGQSGRGPRGRDRGCNGDGFDDPGPRP